jgi:hypothetical protein
MTAKRKMMQGINSAVAEAYHLPEFGSSSTRIRPTWESRWASFFGYPRACRCAQKAHGV